MKLTKDQELARQNIRKAICDRLKQFSLTQEMLRDKSLFQLLNLLELLSGHYNYLGTFTDTARALEEIFGDALFDKPLAIPNTEVQSEKDATVVN